MWIIVSLVTVFSCVSTTTACSCFQIHNQVVVCDAPVVLRVDVKLEITSTDFLKGNNFYLVEIEHVYKDEAKNIMVLNGLAFLKTAANGGLCGVKLNAHTKYVLTGHVGTDGYIRIGLCGYIREVEDCPQGAPGKSKKHKNKKDKKKKRPKRSVDESESTCVKQDELLNTYVNNCQCKINFCDTYSGCDLRKACTLMEMNRDSTLCLRQSSWCEYNAYSDECQWNDQAGCPSAVPTAVDVSEPLAAAQIQEELEEAGFNF